MDSQAYESFLQSHHSNMSKKLRYVIIILTIPKILQHELLSVLSPLENDFLKMFIQLFVILLSCISTD